MKTRLAIIAALAATAAMSTGAYAQIPAPEAPTPGPGVVPSLFPSEQGAFKGLEVAKQLVESYILQTGCENGSFDLSVKTDASGEGHVIIDDVDLTVSYPRTSPYVPGDVRGRLYDVTAASGSLTSSYKDAPQLLVKDVVGHGSYNIGSEMQELTTEWLLESPYSDIDTSTDAKYPYGYDEFRGTIIKDYWRLNAKQRIPGICQTPSAKPAADYGFTDRCKPVSTVIDYGYQQIQKDGFIAAKWWQQSQAWRQNGVRSGTLWHVNRVAPYGDQCEITVVLQGTPGAGNTANRQGFNQIGTIDVGTGSSADTGGIFKK